MMNQRQQDWYRRGRRDALRQQPCVNFNDTPDSWTKEMTDEAENAYDAGFVSAEYDHQRYAAKMEQIREAEGFAAFRDTNDPTSARLILKRFQLDLEMFENLIPAEVLG